MTANKILVKRAKILDILSENQAQIDSSNSTAPWNQVFSIHSNEDTNNLEQKYYDKDRGCFVKAQADNLFVYKFWSQE